MAGWRLPQSTVVKNNLDDVKKIMKPGICTLLSAFEVPAVGTCSESVALLTGDVGLMTGNTM
jgi:hypothetical protein